MARARVLKPGFFTNELLAELPFEGRLLFAGLWTLADRAGRLEDRPKRIKVAVFPFDAVDVHGLLAALESQGFIERYVVDAMPLIQIAKFLEHQTPHYREPTSVLPAPSSSAQESLGQVVPGPSVYGDPVFGNPVCGNGSICAEPLPRSTPPILVFPCNGPQKSWGLFEDQIAKWQDQYEHVDVRAEMRKAQAWCEANGGRQKTARGMPSFLNNWLNRAVNDRRSADRKLSGPANQVPWRPQVSAVEWSCPHVPECGHKGSCLQRQRIDAAKAAS